MTEIKIMTCEELTHNIKNANIIWYKIFYFEQKIGNALIIRYNDEKETHISSLFIESKYRHKGYASMIVRKICEDSPEGYSITAHSGIDLKEFWSKNGLKYKRNMKSEGLYEYRKDILE